MYWKKDYNRKDVIPIDKILENKKAILVIGVLLVIGFAALYVFRGGDIGPGSSEVTNNIQAARDQQQSAIVGVRDAQDKLNDGRAEVGRVSEGLGEVTKSIRGSQSTVEESINRSKSSADLIREGERLVQRVQEENAGRD